MKLPVSLTIVPVHDRVNRNLQLFNPTYMKHIIFNIKPYIHTSVLHSVDARRIFLIRRPGILRQDFHQRRLALLWDKLQACRRAFYLQAVARVPAAEAALCVRVAVRIGQIGLNIKDRGSIHQVGSGNMENRAKIRGGADALQTDAGQSNRIGPEWGTCGKHPHSLIAAKPWRTHSRTPFITDGLGKPPDKPDMGVIFQAAQGIRIAVVRFKDELCLQGFHETALSGDAEFFREIALDMCNCF